MVFSHRRSNLRLPTEERRARSRALRPPRRTTPTSSRRPSDACRQACEDNEAHQVDSTLRPADRAILRPEPGANHAADDTRRQR